MQIQTFKSYKSPSKEIFVSLKLPRIKCLNAHEMKRIEIFSMM